MVENLLKYAVIISGILGIILCLVNAQFDGYSHWTKRLLYFTNQSNLWIVIIYTLWLLPFLQKRKKTLFYATYIFSVSISLTSLMFCCFLGPFADESYHAWSISGILTHVITPMLVIIDFFIQHKFYINKKAVFYTLIPPLIYLILASFLFFINFDFGRGENFPYFFINYFSPAKLIGFSKTLPYFMGTFYWLIMILLLILSLATLLRKVNNNIYLRLSNKDKSTSKYGKASANSNR